MSTKFLFKNVTNLEFSQSRCGWLSCASVVIQVVSESLCDCFRAVMLGHMGKFQELEG